MAFIFFWGYAGQMILTAVLVVMLSGKAWVVDGDTVRINKQKVRLEAIDAPELKQTCYNGKRQQYACGQESKWHLIKLVKGKQIECELVGLDKYGRNLGYCFESGVDLNAAQVSAGHAVAYRKYSTKYVDQEAQAKKQKLGIWQGKFQQPSNFRHPTF